ncbi:MAG: hypothetical protein PVJ49_05755 [Acidobacteriota bacterium]
MGEQVVNESPPAGGNQITEGLERVWSEIKQISKQVEAETRKTGRAARLKLDIRRLEREQQEVRARLGKAVYAARCKHGDGIELSEVEGFAGGVAALDALAEEIAAKRAEAETLRAGDTVSEPPLEESGEVA